jgi:nucleoid DNA-binding protein
MNKTELIHKVNSELEGFTIKEVRMVLNSVINIMLDTVSHNENVAINGFLKIENRFVKGRNGIMNNTSWKTEDRYVAKAKLFNSFIDKVAQNGNK